MFTSAPVFSATVRAPVSVGGNAGRTLGMTKGGADSLASLVSDSALPASSSKVTRTLMALPSSASVTVYVELVAPFDVRVGACRRILADPPVGEDRVRPAVPRP